MNTCDTCKWWSGPDESELQCGLCENDKLASQLKSGEFMDDSLFAGDTESYPIPPIVGPRFGCIHHEPKGIQG